VPWGETTTVLVDALGAPLDGGKDGTSVKIITVIVYQKSLPDFTASLIRDEHTY
jgi:hypothetical protein